MAETNYLNWSMDDIVFDNRNKDYGAYQLRHLSKKYLRWGLIAAVVGFVLFIILSSLDWSWLSKHKEEAVVETTVTLAEPPPLNPNQPPTPPPPPPPPPVRPTIRFVEMIVKKKEEVREDEPPPEVPKDDKAEIATKTVEGDPNAKAVIEEPVVAAAPAEPQIFTFVEQPPQFPGGDAALIAFLQKNIQYPSMERDNDIQGKVLLKFVVLEDGSVSDVKVVRSVSPGLDKEAMRVVKMLPKFSPGKQQGKAVRVYFNLPVVFKLQ